MALISRYALVQPCIREMSSVEIPQTPGLVLQQIVEHVRVQAPVNSSSQEKRVSPGVE